MGSKNLAVLRVQEVQRYAINDTFEYVSLVVDVEQMRAKTKDDETKSEGLDLRAALVPSTITAGRSRLKSGD